MSGSDRFRRLERQRPPSAESGPQLAPDRFAAVAQGHGSTAADSGVASSRFAPAEERLELADPRANEMPFVRCAICKVDSGRTAVRCASCGASFDTPEQRAFNEQVWRELQASQASEHAQDAVRERARADAAIDEAALRRKLAEGIAREARSSALASLSGIDDGPRISKSFGGDPLVTPPAVRWAKRGAIVVFTLVFLSAVGAGKHAGPTLGLCGAGSLLGLALLLLPSWAWTREVSRWGRGRWM